MKKLSLFILLVVLSLCLCACEITEETDPLDSIKVTAVAGVEVKDNSVTLTQSQYNALKTSPAENCGRRKPFLVFGQQAYFVLSDKPCGDSDRVW